MIGAVLVTSDVLTGVAAVLAGLGTVGGLYALRKVRPEADRISVNAAQGAVIVQSGVIESLQQENQRLAERVTQLEARSQNVETLQARVNALTDENTTLRSEAVALKRRVSHLEAENIELREQVSIVKDIQNGGT